MELVTKRVHAHLPGQAWGAKIQALQCDLKLCSTTGYSTYSLTDVPGRKSRCCHARKQAEIQGDFLYRQEGCSQLCHRTWMHMHLCFAAVLVAGGAVAAEDAWSSTACYRHASSNQGSLLSQITKLCYLLRPPHLDGHLHLRLAALLLAGVQLCCQIRDTLAPLGLQASKEQPRTEL